MLDPRRPVARKPSSGEYTSGSVWPGARSLRLCRRRERIRYWSQRIWRLSARRDWYCTLASCVESASLTARRKLSMWQQRAKNSGGRSSRLASPRRRIPREARLSRRKVSCAFCSQQTLHLAHERQISSAALSKTAALCGSNPLVHPRCKSVASDHKAPDAAVSAFSRAASSGTSCAARSGCAGFHRRRPRTVPRKTPGGNIVCPAPKRNDERASTRK